MKLFTILVAFFFSMNCFSQSVESLTLEEQKFILEKRLSLLNEHLKKNNKDTLAINEKLIDYTLKGFKKTINKDVINEYMDLYYYVINHSETKNIVGLLVDQIIIFKDEIKEHALKIPQSRK